MALPNPGMDFTPFDILPAASLDDMVENIEALADGSGLNNGAVTPAKMLGVDLFGRSSTTITGTPPSAGTGQFYMQAGTNAGNFTGGALDITFPTAFPNGVLTVVCTDGDNSSGNGMSVTQNNIGTTSFRAQTSSDGLRRVNWIAIGF